MTEEDTLAMYDFLHQKISGWDIALACNNHRGMTDFRTKASRDSADLMKDIFLNMPDFEDLIHAIQADEDPATLWPADFQETVRFRLWHTVPREINDPLSEYGYEKRQRYQGLDPRPEFVKQYSKPATVSDHPPFPPRSELFKELERSHRPVRDVSKEGKSA